jgi:uroporphyrinogen decarboxylase
MGTTGRECINAVLNHEEPERVPVDFGGRHTTVHKVSHQTLKKYLGIEGGEDIFRQYWLQTVEVDPRVNAILGGDVVAFCTGKPDAWDLTLQDNGRLFYDEWGAGYEMPDGSYYFDYNYHPLAKIKSLADLDQYMFPDPLDPGRYRGLEDGILAAYRAGEKAIMVTIAPAGSWEHTWTLRGPEQALIDLMENRDLYEEILDRTIAFQIAQWEHTLDLVGAFVDVVSMSDDLGMQNGPMISPLLYRELFKPRLIKVIEAIRARTKAKVYLHTDGSVYKFLPDLIEAGIEVINPVQKECRDMGLERLKSEFGDKLTFWGASMRSVRRRVRQFESWHLGEALFLVLFIISNPMFLLRILLPCLKPHVDLVVIQ